MGAIGTEFCYHCIVVAQKLNYSRVAENLFQSRAGLAHTSSKPNILSLYRYD